VTRLDSRLTEIFEGIVDTYDAQPVQRRLLHLNTFGSSGFLDVDWGERPDVTREHLDDLADHGLIDIDYSRKHGNYLVKPSGQGRRAILQLRRERALAARDEAVELSWAAVRPVLRAVVDEWERTGATGDGIAAEDIATALGETVDLQLIRALEALEADEFVAVEWETGSDAPVAVRPQSKAFAGTRGWPDGDHGAMGERLVATLDELAHSNESHSGWAGRARDVLSEVTSKTMAEVIYRAGGGS